MVSLIIGILSFFTLGVLLGVMMEWKKKILYVVWIIATVLTMIFHSIKGGVTLIILLIGIELGRMVCRDYLDSEDGNES